MVTIRSAGAISPARTLSNVVFPAPVPPERRRFQPAPMAQRSNSDAGRWQPEVGQAAPPGAEAADGHARAVDRHRRQHGVEA